MYWCGVYSSDDCMLMIAAEIEWEYPVMDGIMSMGWEMVNDDPARC